MKFEELYNRLLNYGLYLELTSDGCRIIASKNVNEMLVRFVITATFGKDRILLDKASNREVEAFLKGFELAKMIDCEIF